MKIVSSQQISQIESAAYLDGSSESDFMEEAGSGAALIVHDFVENQGLDRHVIGFCGEGNNGGDTYVALIHLLHLEYQVVAIQVAPIASVLCRENHARFIEEGGKVINYNPDEKLIFPKSGVILDGMFGTGFHGTIQEPYASAIQQANDSHLSIIAIDIPSGLNGETGIAEGEAIFAAETAFLGLPKTGFFLRDGWNHVGKLRYVDYGLPSQYIENVRSDLMMLTIPFVQPFLPHIARNRHKYQAGYVIGLAGSSFFPGAAVMASIAALRGGAGIVRLLYPHGLEMELCASPAEILKNPIDFSHADILVELLNKASAVFIGPGLSMEKEVGQMLEKVLPKVTRPCVVDADALSFFADGKYALPPNTILTPHMGEMLRLLHVKSPQPLDAAFLRICQNFAEEKQTTVILKGGPTFIFHPKQPIAICPVGDPGMATAGCGDVLTGLLAALMAQGLPPQRAAYLGTYIHGLAGEYAARELTPYCMTASDVLFYFSEGFRLTEI
jgi:NAD(P)H-hydrate epimerase